MIQFKKVEELTAADLQAFPIWQFTNSHEETSETLVRPVKKTPVKTLTGRLVGTRVRLANSSEIWALIGNVDLANYRLTQHFLTLSVLRRGRWFTMARYHDFDSRDRGPPALATFLGLRVDEIFPIVYDIRSVCLGDPAVLVGAIRKEPLEKLTRAQIVALAVP
jgi:hypothetical protein